MEDNNQWTNVQVENMGDDSSAVPVAEEVTEAPAYALLRRVFARAIDMGLTGTIVTLLCMVIGRTTPENDMVVGILRALLLVPLEVTALHLFGTTLGKWIMGLEVRSRTGERLTWAQAIARSILVYAVGVGLGIPFVSPICCILSYRKYKRGEALVWEQESRVAYPEKFRRPVWQIAILCVAALGLFTNANYLVQKAMTRPKNQGNLTMSRYAENYNQYAQWYKISDRMNPDGTWVAEEKDEITSDGPVTVVVMDLGIMKKDDPVYMLSDDTVTGITLSCETMLWMSGINLDQLDGLNVDLCTIAFARGQEEFGGNDMDSLSRLVEKIGNLSGDAPDTQETFGSGDDTMQISAHLEEEQISEERWRVTVTIQKK